MGAIIFSKGFPRLVINSPQLQFNPAAEANAFADSQLNVVSISARGIAKQANQQNTEPHALLAVPHAKQRPRHKMTDPFNFQVCFMAAASLRAASFTATEVHAT